MILTMPVTDSQETPGAGIGVPQRGRWGVEFWSKHIATEIPAKPDREVIRICHAFRTHYGIGRAIKALSFGIPVDYAIFEWCFGVKDKNRGVHIAMQSMKRRLPDGALQEVPCKRNGPAYIIADPRLLEHIRAVMNGDGR